MRSHHDSEKSRALLRAPRCSSRTCSPRMLCRTMRSLTIALTALLVLVVRGTSRPWSHPLGGPLRRAASRSSRLTNPSMAHPGARGAASLRRASWDLVRLRSWPGPRPRLPAECELSSLQAGHLLRRVGILNLLYDVPRIGNLTAVAESHQLLFGGPWPAIYAGLQVPLSLQFPMG